MVLARTCQEGRRKLSRVDLAASKSRIMESHNQSLNTTESPGGAARFNSRLPALAIRNLAGDHSQDAHIVVTGSTLAMACTVMLPITM